MIRNKEGLLILITLLVLSGAANAADGTINFTGEIMTEGCTLNSTNPLNVNLGKITFPENPNVGEMSSGRQFSISLTCPTGLAGITFSGIADSTSPDLFAVNGGADGVAIGIYKSDGITHIRNGISQTTEFINNKSGSNIYNATLFARYIKTKSAITPGAANASITFNVEY